MSDKIYRLLLVDSDRIFRMGMRAWLSQFLDLLVVAEFDTADAALLFLQNANNTNVDIAERSPNLDLVIVDLQLSQIASENPQSKGLSGLDFCQQVRLAYPNLAILILSASQETNAITSALNTGVAGYCLKGTNPDELITAIRQVAMGNLYLGDRYGLPRESLNPINNLISEFPKPSMNVVDIIRHNFYTSGLRQINQNFQHIQAITANLNDGKMLERMNKFVLEGQARELEAAQWLIRQLWGSRKTEQILSQSENDSNRSYNFANNTIRDSSKIELDDRPSLEVISSPSVLAVQASLWDRAIVKLQNNLSNLSQVPLEIDILKEEKKRELLYLALRQTEQSLTDLRFSQIAPTQLENKLVEVLGYIWQATLTDFFCKYYSLVDQIDFITEINVVDRLLKDEAVIKTELLEKIPQVDNLFSHLLFGTELIIDNAKVAIGTIEAMQRSEVILENLIIQIANAVIQPLLNNFADFEEVKQKFYRYNLMATREIERFRNDLSWKYRLEKYVTAPQLIFESRHRLLILANPGIKSISIYGSRNQELQSLEGIQLAVTLVLELQDALTPRLKSAIAFIGSGFVYVLTNVIGRSIGLVGRGILQGIGNAWQDSRKPKK
ncbi:DUF3685 domain-containing protein [Pseudanabaena biceps]|nr:DUF3685 domain-containing protein [Pseudanabaena biceps]